MATLTELLADPSIPQHLKEQIAQAQVETIQQEAELFAPSDGELSELIGGKGKVTHQHAAGTGKMTLYDTSTGEPREGVNQYAVAKALVKKRDGKPAFSLQPTKTFVRGQVMCYLHPDHPQREYLRGLGLDETQDCGYGSDRPPAAHLASEFDRDVHMEKKHGRPWKVIQANKTEMQRQEQLDMQREQMAAILALAGSKGPTTEATAPVTAYYCRDCPRFFDTEQGLKVHEGRDHKGA